MSNLIDVGKLSAPHGIKGWVKVHSQTEPATNIFTYQPWYLKTKHGVKPVELIEWKPQGKGFVVQIKGVDDRNQAESLCPVGIAVERALLAPLAKDEYYWHQLQACRVVSIYEGMSVDLGEVKRILPTGANDVLVVLGDALSIDQGERLVPYVLGQFVQDVDLEKKIITVDWDPDF
ncbi:MAG: 16S rRNA processing protein RimM [Cellvibrionaceae bacterium]|jgi:16S rRNA processing protein RimM